MGQWNVFHPEIVALCGAPAKPPGSLAAPWENDEVVT